MCLLVLAWNSHPRYRLIVAANRDEYHDRPSAPLGWWPDDTRILAHQHHHEEGHKQKGGDHDGSLTRAGRGG